MTKNSIVDRRICERRICWINKSYFNIARKRSALNFYCVRIWMVDGSYFDSSWKKLDYLLLCCLREKHARCPRHSAFRIREGYPAISVYRDVELVCREIVVYFLRVAVSFPRVRFLPFERRDAPHITHSRARHSVNLLTTIRATPSLIGEKEGGGRERYCT